MAKEWYLLSSSTKPNSIGGYENEGFVDYKNDAFSESLETEIATTVILFNHDLSESQEIRCIIQGNASDTQLKSMERIGLFTPQTVKAGMYIFFENRYWLIDGYPGTQGIYEKATICLCQYNLRWQNKNGDIIERWCNITSASKYDVGEGGNNTIFLTSNNFTIKMTCDNETMELERRRVFIDKRSSCPTKVFKITRNDDVLYDYGEEHGSILSFIADKDELNPKIDNQELRICNYYFPTPSTPDLPINPPQGLTVLIIGGSFIKIGRVKTWSVKFEDETGNDIKFNDWLWNVQSNFAVIKKNNEDNTISLSVKDEDSIDGSFILQVLDNNATILAEKEINVEEGF